MGVETTPRVMTPEVRPPTTRSLGAWWVVVLAGACGLLLLALDQLRLAVVALAVTLWVGAVIRAVVPTQQAGGLVVRSRVFDVLVLAALGTAVLVVGLALRRA